MAAGLLDGVDEEIRPDEYVKLTMPSFDFETDLDLVPLLRSMDMTDPLHSGADFAGITKGAQLFVGEARHKANITVDEKGTEAAAATLLDIPESGTPPPVGMAVNRPLLFAITERETGTIVFLGRVTDPS